MRGEHTVKQSLGILVLVFAMPLFAQERSDYGKTRPTVAVPEELTVTFSAGDLELDFRASYLANEAQLFTALYEGLYSYNPVTMEPVRALAARSELSADKKVWTFTIRSDARYANGDPVRAEDFQAAWLSLLDPVRNSPYSSLFDIIEGARHYRLGLVSNPQSVGISAEGRTLVVRLTAPASFFPSMLCHHSFSPIHPSMLTVTDWSEHLPVTNGPFTIVEKTAERILLKKNPYYWDIATVAINTLTIRLIENATEAAALWNTGEARWIAGDVDIDTLTDRSGIVVNPLFATHYYYIRSAQRPWNDYRVRRALVLVLPWDEIRKGYYMPATTLIYPLSGYPQLDGLTVTNIEEAQTLLTEAGYPKGIGLPELVIKISPAADAARLATLMATAWLEKLGITVRINIVPYAQYFDAMKQNDYTVGSSTWIGDFADPYTFLQMWRQDSNLNDAHYSDSDYENLIERSMAEEGQQRLSTLAEAEKLLLERGSIIPIYYSPALNIVDIDEIDGWYPNALDIHPFKYLKFKPYRTLPGVAQAPDLSVYTVRYTDEY
ncbi:MAG: peptide ABC transporter substrate-binding protein [Spirochaetaceae bacterium]|nr:peptide ABC transporter substrate-binding protein [Spirochaetaceae bacterium]